MVLWGLIGYTDFSRQRIQHRYLFWGAAAAATGYLLLIGGWLLRSGDLASLLHPHGFFRGVVTHVLLCVLAAMGLWQFRVWPAGDAKLFVLLSLFYPLTLTEGILNHESLFLSALINAFIPAAFYVFARACAYIIDTRVKHARNFFKNMGWRKEAGYLRGQLEAALHGMKPALNAFYKELAANPWYLATAIFQWLLGSVTMAVISYHLHDFFRSPLLLSLLCMGAFFVWSRLRSYISGYLGTLLGAGILIALLFKDGVPDWGRLSALFGNISIFGFFMFLGMNLAMRWLSHGGYLAFILPFLFSLAGWALSSIISAVAPLLRSAATALSSLGAPVHGPALVVPNLPAFLAPHLETFAQMAAFGLFFGLSLVLVRRWDEEVRPTHTRDALSSYLILSPAIVDRIKADKKFYEKYFKTLYADGLTQEQADALKRWCSKNGIDAVALTPTISFASWIFLGFFLTRIFQGRSLLEALLR
jgi:hypothetical protein